MLKLFQRILNSIATLNIIKNKKLRLFRKQVRQRK